MTVQATNQTVRKTIAILGAGINGAALARELLLSGVSVVVIDTADIAAGATAWSTRLVHGGLRYLEYGEVELVRESLVERDRLVRLAPHLVRPLEFYLPVRTRLGGMAAAVARLLGWESLARAWQGTRGRGSWTVGMGLWLYDQLPGGSGWPRHRMVRASAGGMPAVDADGFPFAGLYWDAQLLFPERFTVELFVDARLAAAETGAEFRIFTHHRCRLEDGTLVVEPIACARGSDAIRIEPAAVVNATGAWVDQTLAEALPAVLAGRLIGGTKGSHLLLRSARLRTALGNRGIYAEAADGRPVFVLPFGERLVLVGTTDLPFSGDPDDARTDEAEIDYLLGAVAGILPNVAASREDVLQHYCGVRPLPFVSRDGGTPASITRRHMLVRHADTLPPCWSIVGGKLTTCRSLAETAAAEVLAQLGIQVGGSSRDRRMPGWFERQASVEAVARGQAVAAGLPDDLATSVARQVVGLYGSRAVAVCTAIRAERRSPPGLASSGPSPADQLLIRDVDLPKSAVAWSVREEWATGLEDVVERRLMLVFDERLSRRSLEDIAAVLVEEGLLEQEKLTAEVEAVAERLRQRYGKTLEGTTAC